MNLRIWRLIALLLVAHLVVALPLAAQPTMTCESASPCCPSLPHVHACCAMPTHTGSTGVTGASGSTCVVVTGQTVDLARATAEASIEFAAAAHQPPAAPRVAPAKAVAFSGRTTWSPRRYITVALSPRAPPTV